MKIIGYFVNQYPKVSHSFIRREILALETQGYQIHRFALRSNVDELVDPLDQIEWQKTRYILSQPLLLIIFTLLKRLAFQPIKFIKVLVNACKMGWRSDRGLLRHLIYFIEACLLYEWQQQTQITHIHAHFGTNSTTVVMFAYQLGGVNYSFTVHGPEEFDKPEFIELTEKIIHSQFVVAISSYGRSQLFRWVDQQYWSKIHIIRCGLAEDFLHSSFSEILSTAKPLICVGRLCEQKGQLLLLEAIKQLHDQGTKCELLLAGDGEMRPLIEQKIKAYQLENFVKISGWINSQQVKSYLQNSIALILPSFAEGLPVVIMEAFALHKPVISTYIAGIPELVIPNYNGWLIPAGEINSLVQAIQQLLSTDSEQLKMMGQHGFEIVRQQHDIYKETQKLARLFEQVIE
jgi:glycosyltransferase involved in cell wall biosynthesis